jgi:hypothetical protein
MDDGWFVERITTKIYGDAGKFKKTPRVWKDYQKVKA